MFPADDILIARGKHATLKREWHAQVKRVQDICRTMQMKAPLILADCQEKPPVDGSHVVTIEKCIQNLNEARERLITLSAGIAELEPDAWGSE